MQTHFKLKKKKKQVKHQGLDWRDNGRRETVLWQALTLVGKCQNVKAFYSVQVVEALFDTQ